MAVILGMHHGHHGTVCIVKDGKLIGALSLERLTRNKFEFGVTKELIDYLFASFGINKIDYVALSDWNKQFANGIATVKHEGKEEECLWNRIYDNTCLSLEVELLGKSYPGFYIGHQLAHAAAAYYTSPFEESFCLTLDASGAKVQNNSLVSYGKGKELTSLYCPNLMVGVGYGAFTESLGIGSQLMKAGSTMALAGYGNVLPKVLENLDYYVTGNFCKEIHDYHQWYEKLWIDLNGSSASFPWCWSIPLEGPETKKAQDLAATIQFIFEQSILKCVDDIESSGVTNICLGGGSMLNCVSNTRVLLESKFNNVHLFPGCSDDGGAIGAALYVSHNVLKEERHVYKDEEVCYLGAEKSSIEPDYQYLAKQLANDKIIAWSNGRSEMGPRALGNRSIFADPRVKGNRDRINFKVKNREWFRPLAPIVMEEYCKGWFDFEGKSQFMLFTAKIKEPDLIPAVNHVDGSARIQTMTEESNPHCYRLIKEFYNLTGVPVLLNTSFNENGEPMVESDEQALEFFNRGKVDILVLNGTIHERN
jgi:carbamoyltransferase